MDAKEMVYLYSFSQSKPIIFSASVALLEKLYPNKLEETFSLPPRGILI